MKIKLNLEEVESAVIEQTSKRIGKKVKNMKIIITADYREEPYLDCVELEIMEDTE